MLLVLRNRFMWDFSMNKFIKISYASPNQFRSTMTKHLLGYQVDEVAPASMIFDVFKLEDLIPEGQNPGGGQ